MSNYWGMPPPYGYGPPPPFYGPPVSPHGEESPTKQLKRSLKFWRQFEREYKKKEEETKKKPKVALKDRLEVYMILVIFFPIIGPLYILFIKHLLELLK